MNGNVTNPGEYKHVREKLYVPKGATLGLKLCIGTTKYWLL